MTAPGGQTVAPGETKKIIVKMSTHSYTSNLHKEIKIETNDPGASLITLTMKAQVFVSVKVLPTVLNFGRVSQNQTAAKEVTVTNAGKKPFKVTRILTSPATKSSLAVAPDEPFTLKPGESRKLTVKLSTGAAEGFLDSSLTLETDLPYFKEKRIFMHAEVKGDQGETK